MARIITIDGPAGSGKSTVSRLVSRRLKAFYLDTGAMYRAVAYQARRKGVNPLDGQGLKALCRDLDLRFETKGDAFRLYLGDEDISLAIRTPEMDMLSSDISAVREVREAMTQLQRKVGQGADLVAEGRDMGTVVFPEAGHKFFLTADPEVRAERRYRERKGRGESPARADVQREILERDRQDKGRALAPLRPAEDATVINTTDLSPEQVTEMIVTRVARASVPGPSEG
jgi:cytidylate kinase